jgi:hypothetical protein
VTIFRIVILLFFLLSLSSCPAPVARASFCEDIHNKLAEGRQAQKQDADSINTELLKDRLAPFKHLVAAEVMVSLGLYGLAEPEFEEADRLEKNYVQTKFHEELKANHNTVGYLYRYVEEKHPKDPALLFYLSRRHLAELARNSALSPVSVQPIIEELRAAAGAKQPWAGTFALLAMLEYKEASNTAGESRGEDLLRLAIKHANQELKQDPNNPLALKVRIMSALKCGASQSRLAEDCLQAVRLLPRDPEMNVLLSRVYLEKKDYKTAIQPLLIALLSENDSSIRNDLLRRAADLARRANVQEFSVSINRLLADPVWEAEKKPLLYLRVADLLALAGKPEAALTLLEQALLDCPPASRSLIEFKTGQVLTSMNRFADAYPYLKRAAWYNPDPYFARKVMSFCSRVGQIKDNYHRDIALQLKCLVSPKRQAEIWIF